MNQIKFIKDLSQDNNSGVVGDKTVEQLFDGAYRRIVEVRLRNNAVLSRHHADVPITVYCVSGHGVFSAGEQLEDEQELSPGVLITLESGVEHEVIADPDLQILVTKFKSS